MSMQFLLTSGMTSGLTMLNMLLPNIDANKDDAMEQLEHEFAKHDEAEDETLKDEATIIDSAVPTVVAIKDI